MSQPRLCILGGTGFVGRQLAARFAARGFEVRVLTRTLARYRGLPELEAVQLVEADVFDGATLRRETDGCEGVINLIGILNERGHRGRGFQRTHVQLTENVIEACRAGGVTRLLHMSALHANPDAPSHYLRSKGLAAQRVLAAANDLHVTVFEPSTIFGAGDSFMNRFAGLLRLLPVFPLACPHTRFAPVYVGDVADAFVKSYADTGTFGKTYSLCGPATYTLIELVRMTAHASNLHRWVFGLPDWAAWMQAAVMEWVPGKPFSLDNYHSLQIDSVCRDNGFEYFGIKPASLEAILPTCLGRN